MDYNRLTDANKTGEGDIPDGYDGKITHVTYHLVDGIVWVKAPCGCYRDPRTAQDLAEVLRLHKMWTEGIEGGAYANFSGADLSGANLRYANLTRADLTGANLDFSAVPLWCGGTRFVADDRLVAQVLAHLCSLKVSDKARAELDKVLDFAKTSHRAQECGLLDEAAE